MQRHVLVLLVTFDLWVSLLVSVLPCLFFGFGCGFASAGLSGLGCSARLRLLQWSLGCLCLQPSLFCFGAHPEPWGGQMQGSATPLC